MDNVEVQFSDGDLIEDYGVEHFKRFYTPIRGYVSSNQDPEKRGRIKAFFPVFNQKTIDQSPDKWIDPIFLGAGTRKGHFFVPSPKDQIIAFFDKGDSSSPLFYIGAWHGKDEIPEEFSYEKIPHKKGFASRLGHSLTFSDDPNNQFVKLQSHFPESSDKALSDESESAQRTGKKFSIEFTQNGIEITTHDKRKVVLSDTDKKITLSDGQNTIEMSDSGVTVQDKNNNLMKFSPSGIELKATTIKLDCSVLNLDGDLVTITKNAVQSLVLGENLQASYNLHNHISAAPGSPTTPPTIPLNQTAFSRKIKVG